MTRIPAPLKSGGAKLESAGDLDLKGSVIELNNGGKTVGSHTTQTIATGSSTVLVP